MKPHAWLVALAVGASLGTVLLAQGFNIRTGNWEITLVMQGGLPMDGVPPEVRAQIEAEFRKPQVFTSCVTAEDLRSVDFGRSAGSDDECRVVTSAITPTSADVTRECAGDEPRTETAHFEAPTPQSLRGNVSIKQASGTMTMAMTARWITAQCSD